MTHYDKKSFIEYVCREFLESQDMADYLSNAEANPRYDSLDCMYDIIIGSRAALDQKILALEALSPLWTQADRECSCNPEPAKLAREARRALAETERAAPGTVFMVRGYFRDFEAHNAGGEDLVMEFGAPPFTTFTEVLQFIHKSAQEEMEDEMPTDDINTWFTAERWDINGEGKLAHTASWYLSYTGKIWGFAWEDDSLDDDDCNIMPAYSFDLLLYTPFLSGDVILVDSRPYQELALGIILDADGQNDCCSPQCMVIRQQYAYGRGKPAYVAAICALKHWPYSDPRFSALLRARYAQQADIAAFAEHQPSLCDAIPALSERIKRDPAFLKRCSDYLYDLPRWQRMLCDVQNIIDLANEA